MNEENIDSICNEAVLPYGQPIHICVKYYEFTSMCDCPDKYIKFTEWLCVLNCCSEYTGVFVTDAEINCDEDIDLPFISFSSL